MYAWILTRFGASMNIQSQIDFNTRPSQMLSGLEVRGRVAPTQIISKEEVDVLLGRPRDLHV